MPEATLHHLIKSFSSAKTIRQLRSLSRMTAVTDLGFGARMLMATQASKEAACSTCCTFDDLHVPEFLSCWVNSAVVISRRSETVDEPLCRCSLQAGLGNIDLPTL